MRKVIGMLCLVFIMVLVMSKSALAATPATSNICTWNNSTGSWNDTTGRWLNCGGTYPGVNDTAIINGGTVNVDSPNTVGTLTLMGGTLQGSGTLTVTGTMTWTGNSTMAGSGATTLASGASATITTIWANPGNYPILDERTFNINGSATISGNRPLCLDDAAVINVASSGTLDFQSDAGMDHENGAAVNINNNGLLVKSQGTSTSDINGVQVNNNGTVKVQSGTLQFSNYTQNSGVTLFAGGAFTASNTPFTFLGGLLKGSGTINGNVVNTGGTVSPGNSPGSITITGNYTQGAAGSLNIEIGGNTPATQYDVLNITGTATLSGTLNITQLNGFIPAVGSTFTVINYASYSGQFINQNGNNFMNQVYLAPTYQPTQVILTTELLFHLYLPLLQR